MRLRRFLLAAGSASAVALGMLAPPFVGCARGGEPAQAPAPAAPAEEAADPEVLARVQVLLQELRGPDAGKRDAAQKTLQEIGKSAVAPLRQLAAETGDEDVRRRCEFLVEDYAVGRWDRLLKKAFREDREFLAVVKEVWEDAAPVLEEAEWEETLRKGKGRIEVPGVDEVLAEPCRFYVMPGFNCGLLCRPPIYMTVGVTEKGRLFLFEFNLRRYEGLPVLRSLLKPVKDAKGARRAALLAARLLALCPSCFYGPGYPAPAEADVAVKPRDGGGFEATIPDAGGGGARVLFSADGRLDSAERIGHPCRGD